MARIRRRSVLRITAFPTATLMANATLGGISPASTTQRTQTGPLFARGAADSWANTSRSRIDQIRPTAGDDPWPGEPSEWIGRRGWTSGDGTRASWIACDCLVEKFVSSRASSTQVRRRPGPFWLARLHFKLITHGHVEGRPQGKRRKARPRAPRITTGAGFARYPQGRCYGSTSVIKQRQTVFGVELSTTCGWICGWN